MPEQVSLEKGIHAAEGAAKRVLILHYHEIWLKGGNKRFFQSRLVAAVKRSLEDLSPRPLEVVLDRLLVPVPDERQLPLMVERLRRVFGLAYIGMAWEVSGGMPEL
ncbi:MAG TPA: hypothetical protein VGW37_13575, partial [Terriglobia bacterium]|nr:hypothetical protein [Terriglobia bacterium]